MKKLLIGLTTIVVLFLLYSYFINPWSRINCWTGEVDINTGQKRYTRYIAYIPTERSITDTWVSTALEKKNEGREWRMVYTLSPGVNHSPHYSYHSALSDIKMFTQVIEYGRIEKEALPSVARVVIELWKQNDGDYEAGTFLQIIESEAWERAGNEPITLEDLERLVVETKQSDPDSTGQPM